MIKVFTSVFILEDTAVALDAMKEALPKHSLESEADRRQTVELQVEVTAIRGRMDRNA
ncbi:hypothetical protein [Occallatibacter savannae]|uniref:hypothetical protein n=1 Tax=Occallatibacter savannae TaxID=1002691 RepID=UPI0013A5B6A0|nr:hypothetical protein [Occallatibacter savannae]